MVSEGVADPATVGHKPMKLRKQCKWYLSIMKSYAVECYRRSMNYTDVVLYILELTSFSGPDSSWYYSSFIQV